MKFKLLVILFLMVSPYAQATNAESERPVVKTADDAVRMAYAYWRALAPDSAPVPEEKWDAEFEAVLQGDVWCVNAKHAADHPAWFGMYVGARDGRYLGAFDLGTPQTPPCGTKYGSHPSN
jgi:hypothetical protein